MRHLFIMNKHNYLEKILNCDKYLTTGDIAEILLISQRTASALFDKGYLKGFHVFQNRRILPGSLIEFMKEFKIPFGLLNDPKSDWHYKTGEAAEACLISRNAIIRCFDKNILKGFSLPLLNKGLPFRRIPHSSLVNFMEEHKISLEYLLDFMIKSIKPEFTARFITDNKEYLDFERTLPYINRRKKEMPIEYTGRFAFQYGMSGNNQNNFQFREITDYIGEYFNSNNNK